MKALTAIRLWILALVGAGALACSQTGGAPMEMTDPSFDDEALLREAETLEWPADSMGSDEPNGASAWPETVAPGSDRQVAPAPGYLPAPILTNRPAPTSVRAPQGIQHPPLGTAPPVEPREIPPAGPVEERTYPDLPPPVSHSYPPAGQSGFIMEKRETPHSRTYTVFPTRSEPPQPPSAPGWGHYPLDIHAWPPVVPPAQPPVEDPRRRPR